MSGIHRWDSGFKIVVNSPDEDDSKIGSGSVWRAPRRKLAFSSASSSSSTSSPTRGAHHSYRISYESSVQQFSQTFEEHELELDDDDDEDFEFSMADDMCSAHVSMEDSVFIDSDDEFGFNSEDSSELSSETDDGCHMGSRYTTRRGRTPLVAGVWKASALQRPPYEWTVTDVSKWLQRADGGRWAWLCPSLIASAVDGRLLVRKHTDAGWWLSVSQYASDTLTFSQAVALKKCVCKSLPTASGSHSDIVEKSHSQPTTHAFHSEVKGVKKDTSTKAKAKAVLSADTSTSASHFGAMGSGSRRDLPPFKMTYKMKSVESHFSAEKSKLKTRGYALAKASIPPASDGCSPRRRLLCTSARGSVDDFGFSKKKSTSASETALAASTSSPTSFSVFCGIKEIEIGSVWSLRLDTSTQLFEYSVSVATAAWSVSQVHEWVCTVRRGMYTAWAGAFRMARISGTRLLAMTRETLTNVIGIRSPRLRKLFYDELRALTLLKPCDIRQDEIELMTPPPPATGCPKVKGKGKDKLQKVQMKKAKKSGVFSIGLQSAASEFSGAELMHSPPSGRVFRGDVSSPRRALMLESTGTAVMGPCKSLPLASMSPEKVKKKRKHSLDSTSSSGSSAQDEDGDFEAEDLSSSSLFADSSHSESGHLLQLLEEESKDLFATSDELSLHLHNTSSIDSKKREKSSKRKKETKKKLFEEEIERSYELPPMSKKIPAMLRAASDTLVISAGSKSSSALMDRRPEVMLMRSQSHDRDTGTRMRSASLSPRSGQSSQRGYWRKSSDVSDYVLAEENEKVSAMARKMLSGIKRKSIRAKGKRATMPPVAQFSALSGARLKLSPASKTKKAASSMRMLVVGGDDDDDYDCDDEDVKDEEEDECGSGLVVTDRSAFGKVSHAQSAKATTGKVAFSFQSSDASVSEWTSARRRTAASKRTPVLASVTPKYDRMRYTASGGGYRRSASPSSGRPSPRRLRGVGSGVSALKKRRTKPQRHTETYSIKTQSGSGLVAKRKGKKKKGVAVACGRRTLPHVSCGDMKKEASFEESEEEEKERIPVLTIVNELMTSPPVFIAAVPKYWPTADGSSEDDDDDAKHERGLSDIIMLPPVQVLATAQSDDSIAPLPCDECDDFDLG